MKQETLRRHRTTYNDYAPRTFRAAFERCRSQTEITTHGSGFNGNEPNVNLSDIFSAIIRASGHVTTAYNSDILYDIDTIKTVLNRAANHAWLSENFTDIVVIGFRKSGADSTDAILQKLESTVDLMTGFVHADMYYHTILAVEILATAKEPAPKESVKLSRPRLDVTLRDITNDVYKLDPADVKDEFKKQRLTEINRPKKESVRRTPEEIETAIRKYYEVYLKHWLYDSGLTIQQIADYLKEHETLKGVTEHAYDEPHDYESFKTNLLLSEDYMFTVLNGKNLFDEYMSVIDDLYPEK